MIDHLKRDPALLVGALLSALALAALGPIVFPRLAGLNQPAGAERESVYTIPEGTAEIIRAGGDPKLVPAEMLFTLGVQDVLVIHNEDVTAHTFGPYWVAAHNTLRVQFAQPSVFEGFCSVHPSRQVRIVVRSRHTP